MFESIAPPTLAARLQTAALPPLAAFLAALAYFTIYPALPRVPAALFWLVVALLFTGAVLGIVNIVRVARSERIRGRDLGWMIGAIAITGVCARLALGMALPWL